MPKNQKKNPVVALRATKTIGPPPDLAHEPGALQMPRRMRAETVVSLRLLAKLGRRLGSDCALAVAAIEAALGEAQQGRLATRDEALVELAALHVDVTSESGAARAVADELRKYAGGAWRRERALAAPPEVARGTARELCWRALQATDGRVPAVRTVRRIIAHAVGQTSRIVLANPLVHDRRVTRGGRGVRDNNVIEILSKSPEFRKAADAAHAELVESRKAHLAAMEKLDAAATRAWAGEEREKATAIAAEKAAFLGWQRAQDELNAVNAKISAARATHDRARREHEFALLNAEVPEFAAVEAFREECYEALAATSKARVSSETTSINPSTRAVTRKLSGNGESVKARLAAIRETLRDLSYLKLLPDPRQIADAIDRTRASWPRVRMPDEAA